jgi:hypothetical protein
MIILDLFRTFSADTTPTAIDADGLIHHPPSANHARLAPRSDRKRLTVHVIDGHNSVLHEIDGAIIPPALTVAKKQLIAINNAIERSIGVHTAPTVTSRKLMPGKRHRGEKQENNYDHATVRAAAK